MCLLQSYGRDAAVTSLARSMPALQGLTYEGTGNGLGIGYGMMQSHSLGNAYMVRSSSGFELGFGLLVPRHLGMAWAWAAA